MAPNGRTAGYHRARNWAGQAAATLVLLGLLTVPGGAAELELGGNVGHYLFYGTGQGSLMQNELRYRLSARARPGWDGQVYLLWKGTAALSAGTGSSPLFESPPSSPWPSLDEAYVDFYLPAADLRLGWQVVRWGTADGINPTDVINPRSASLDALVDREARRLPVPAVRVAMEPRPGLGLTAVGVANFVPAPFPREAVEQLAREVAAASNGGQLASDWLSLTALGPGSRYELAVRAETMLGGYNVYLSHFSGYDDFPALWMEPAGPNTWRVRGQYRRQQQFGLAVAGTVGEAGVWAEAAYTLPERLSQLETPLALSTNAATWQAVVGGDYTFANNLYVSAQFVYNQAGSILLPYRPPIDQGARTYGVGLLRYSPPQSRYTWEALALSNLQDGGTVVAPGVSYELRSGLRLVLRYLDVWGSGGSEFGRLRPQLQGVATRLELVF